MASRFTQESRRSQVEALEREVAERQEKLTERKAYKIALSSKWRERLDPKTRPIGDELCNVVYAMAANGASKADIIRYWGLSRAELDRVAGDAYEAGRAELMLTLKADQIDVALTSRNPIMKIWAGKMFAEQSENVSNVESGTEAGGLTINITPIKVNRDASGEVSVEIDADATEETFQG